MKKKSVFIPFLLVLSIRCIAQNKIACIEYNDYILTHELTPTGPIPTAFDPNGVYPYISYSETSNRPVPKKYKFIVLENDHIKITICPDLGGKVYSMNYKPSGKEVLYVPDVIRYTRILPRFYFVAGGIEISFPISHSPSQNETVLYKIDRTRERIYITCGERELRFGMQWSVEYSLGTDDNFLTQRVIFYNPGTSAYPWMSWSNAALPSAPDTKYDFPKGRVLSHSSKIDTINWETQGPKTESGIKEMTGYFWKTKDANAFGAYTPSFGTGLYHIADEKIAPGIKLWSYGVGDDSTWSMLSTSKHQTYIEIQGGPIGDQSIKLEMQPKETRWHVEYWFPTDKELDIYSLKVPVVNLRSVKDIPLFQWARENEVKVWKELSNAYKTKSKLPEPPPIDQNCWASSGMENLDAAFRWAINNATGEKNDLWKFYYGTWLAGRGESEAAIQILSTTKTGVAKSYIQNLANLVKDGKVKMTVIDDAVRRILRKKFELGLFDDPFKFCNKQREQQQWNNPENLRAARMMAGKSIVLLKNDNHLLPLSKQIKTIALIGPFVKGVRDNLGFWSYDWPDDSTRIVTVWDGIKKKLSTDTRMIYAKGCNINDTSHAEFQEAIAAANNSDIVIVSVGEARDMSGEAKSRSNIHLPGVQEELIKAIHATGKPVVVLISAGRPLIFNWTADNVPAILYTWWLGTEAGDAIADVLFGDYNPSAKLPISFPRTEGQIPIYYNHYNTGRPATSDSDRFYRSAYIDLSIYPKYEFGYGLSYSTFSYSDISISKNNMKANETITAIVTVTNTGKYDGEEIVQLYINDVVASITRPVKELKDFQKIKLKAGESKQVTFTITVNDLKFYAPLAESRGHSANNSELKYIAEPGDFKIFVGGNSRDLRETTFKLL